MRPQGQPGAPNQLRPANGVSGTPQQSDISNLNQALLGGSSPSMANLNLNSPISTTN